MVYTPMPDEVQQMLLECELLMEFSNDSNLFTDVASKCTEEERKLSEALAEELATAAPNQHADDESRCFIRLPCGLNIYYKDQYTAYHI